ncbi:MAG TPA: glycosyl hydrolase [Conexibacter sp.]|nr:glycosyl hydrolase [Conexibacter sp.]
MLALAPAARADAPTSTDTSTLAAEGASSTDWFDYASASDWSWSDWFSGESDALASEAGAQAAPANATPSDATTPADAASVAATPADTSQTSAQLTATTSTIETNTLAAPTMSVSGQTVSWTPTQGVSSYVFARKIPGQATQYSIVSGTSTTPPAVPGTTVSYGVRTNVSGSSWAQEVSITYPASSPSPTPSSVGGPFQMGVVAGSALSYELSFIKTLGAHTARLEFGIGTSASTMASVIDAYARAGVRPMLLATFYGTTPTTAQAQNLASWAAAYGPGGTFWAGKSYPANTAVTDIEFGNETSYSYQFSDNSSSTYAARAKAYALAAKAAATAIAAANPNVGLLVQGDNAQQGTSWVTNMFAAVPNLGSYAAGWTIHPYGPNWASRIDSTVNSTASAGSPAKPIWVTEWGLSSDNGRCLDDNYGFNKCMTYSEAATTLHSALTGMLSRYGSRLGAFFLYQAHDQYASGTQSGREAYFGAMQSNGATKGAYTPEVESDLAAH